jgi:UDP:flavonoid glycosyltransferase YjiC (YdhE family)
MARIAFAWELGANYGHLSRTLPVAESLRAAGHTVLFAVPDLRIARSLLVPKGFAFVAAPRLPVGPPGKSAANYGQLLAEQGYSNRDSLRACVAAWLTLWRNAEVDAIVIDYAPTAQLAARILRKPHVLLGIGFAIPPVAEPLPSFRPWEKTSLQELRLSDEALTANINIVLQEFGGAPLRRLADMFAGLPALVTTFAELDYYGARPGVTFIGPTESPATGTTVHWQHSDRPHVFAYLRRDMRSFEPTLAALREFPAETICVIPDATPELLHRARAWPIRLFADPVDLHALLSKTDAVVSYGGAGVVAQCVGAGVPMLILPHALEQYMNAERVAALEAGIVAHEPRSVAGIREQLNKLLTDARYRLAAQQFSQRYASFDPSLASQHAADAIAHVAGGVTQSSPAVRHSPRQRRVLYAWELGANAGHIERGAAIADALRSRGWDPIFAIRQFDLAQRVLLPRGFHYVSCPIPPALPSGRAPVNYSDLLLECGFDDATALSARVHAWVELYRWLKPGMVVLDYAPTAQLAAYICGLPSVLVGSAFYIPPCTDPLPSIQPRKQIVSSACLR